MKTSRSILICLFLVLCMVSALAPGAVADPDWTREGFFADEAGNMVSITWMDDVDEPGWYVAAMLGEDLIEDSYGGMLQLEEDSLRGLLSNGENDLNVTVSGEGDNDLLFVVEGGETYHFVPMALDVADISLRIDTEGIGQFTFAEEGQEQEGPSASAQMSLFGSATYLLGAVETDPDWQFVKWTKNGDDYSTDVRITVEVTEDAEYIAVFEHSSAADGATFEETGDIDYLALVNKQNPLPEGWEDALETVEVTNSVGDDVVVEAKANAAYEQLRDDLAVNNAIYLELDSAYRSVEEQQDIMDRFIEKYGEDYAAKTVAQPGYSEHQTGIALDLYFRIENDYGEFIDVYYNEDMEKEEYKEIWDEIHAKLADYGFILRYLEGEEHITGYRYEPWHIRYVDSVEIAQEIMSQPGLTLEEYLAGESAPEVEIDLSGSELYTEDELYDAMLAIKCNFAAWEGCELHNIRYAGDEANNEENLEWLNTLNENGGFTQVAEFLTDFHSPVEAYGAWAEDTEYTDYQWWLARTEDGDWELVSCGY